MKEKSFEEALEKVEKIIENLEEEDLPLKEGINKFKEGIKLLKFCDKEVREAEMIIQKIVDKDGKIKLEKINL